MQSAKFFAEIFRRPFAPVGALVVLAVLAGCAAPPEAARKPVSPEPAARSQAEARTGRAADAYPNTYPYTVANPYAGAFDTADLPAPDMPPRPAGAITITLLLPMSSTDENVRTLANTLLQAAQLALFDVARPELLCACRIRAARRSAHKPRRGRAGGGH